MEPQGDWFSLPPGERCEIKFVDGGAVPELEVEIEDNLLNLYISCQKQIWKDGVQIK